MKKLFRPSDVYYPDDGKAFGDEEHAGAVVYHGNLRYRFFFGNYGRGEWTIKVDGSVFCDLGEEVYL